MPAENIYGLGQPGSEPTPYVRVSWGADMNYVQVASLFEPQRGAEVVIAMVNEWLKAAGLDPIPSREELNTLIKKHTPGSIPDQFGVTFNGFHATLDDRRAANKLVAVGKRSRDSAFGKDE